MSRYSKFACVCLVLFTCTLTADGHRFKGPSGCYYNLRSCKAKCCGNGKTCESTTYRGRTWYKCVTVDCGSLSDPANGFVTTLGGTSFESLATYTCSEGFVLSSTASGTCLSSGHWSFTAPTCQPDPECLPLECGPLDQPCNGHVDSSGVLPGDVANYSCETGFELQGESSRTCLDSGEWDGIAPCCVKTCRQMDEYSGTYETSSYRIVLVRLTWEDARLNCLEDGANLAEIEDAGETAYISSFVEQGMIIYWLGGNDIAQEGNWVWASDNRPIINYTAWSSYEIAEPRPDMNIKVAAFTLLYQMVKKTRTVCTWIVLLTIRGTTIIVRGLIILFANALSFNVTFNIILVMVIVDSVAGGDDSD